MLAPIFGLRRGMKRGRKWPLPPNVLPIMAQRKFTETLFSKWECATLMGVFPPKFWHVFSWWSGAARMYSPKTNTNDTFGHQLCTTVARLVKKHNVINIWCAGHIVARDRRDPPRNHSQTHTNYSPRPPVLRSKPPDLLAEACFWRPGILPGLRIVLFSGTVCFERVKGVFDRLEDAIFTASRYGAWRKSPADCGQTTLPDPFNAWATQNPFGSILR